MELGHPTSGSKRYTSGTTSIKGDLARRLVEEAKARAPMTAGPLGGLPAPSIEDYNMVTRDKIGAEMAEDKWVRCIDRQPSVPGDYPWRPLK